MEKSRIFPFLPCLWRPETIGENPENTTGESPNICFLGTNRRATAASGRHFLLVSVEFGCENDDFVNPSADKEVDELQFLMAFSPTEAGKKP